MGVDRRLLPVQVQPIEGETLDSWLEATALATGGTLKSVVVAANLPAATVPSWRRSLSSAQLQALRAETGVSGETLEAMTLSRYDGSALQLDSRTRRLDPNFPFGAQSWSRFCPACLRETGGRWQLSWFLPWSFACLKHKYLLVDYCPGCHVHQRSTLQYRRVPTPSVCRGSQPLDSAPTVQLLGDDHSFLWSQRAIGDVIDKGQIGFGVFRTHPRNRNHPLDGSTRRTPQRPRHLVSLIARECDKSQALCLNLRPPERDRCPLRA
ncbi:MAG: TniQ family protein [Mycolicibacterium rufum]|nr:TniQ family protein [Mycolicibacterium rufum]